MAESKDKITLWATIDQRGCGALFTDKPGCCKTYNGGFQVGSFISVNGEKWPMSQKMQIELRDKGLSYETSPLQIELSIGDVKAEILGISNMAKVGFIQALVKSLKKKKEEFLVVTFLCLMACALLLIGFF